MKVRIDAARCEGHGRCYMLAPEVFESDEIGQGRVRSETIAADLLEQVQLAVRNCPENAITVIASD